MSIRERILPPAGDGAPPAPPQAPDPIDEGPMRRELLRQIGELEVQLSAARPGWAPTCTTPKRGPAMAPTPELEALRDELLRALRGPASR
ncbi:hypothetical protein NBH00_04185 [Paraconexibacter antarcticus]|uniref:Uncharacterized protein n=1 Tax=Paraconexibacter antarcticus TaxID=2949664 RepID=A0ABY5DWE4_9ACTN|nr:hypothetical protein [Paraconexibacter antarcticus]UTI65416.1 hypothetical protein NBH00_04185 [Paraconexibacter antarcticus]